ncbi:MarR family winged helix-turn-helix transcriptional regulator [Marinobacter sp.]|jgi:MarR family transcriptional regulator, organic hydroperoxide resistance regulator|uniref:MarR family winged helix-turn-helix transcriptional regulator n=1 Tax=Marinobacter sp. TaxID=50741 RepID=UPI000C4D3E3F|nr:MarR family transcriptional regulator [Marinobacter sp.]MBE96071.1 MarR family transcriptional regulator [Marinobacter sp.]|tara:strand:- start:378 stop:848 length:471 start_codon:yes stop_codon:yes gene_type:complete
MTDEDDILTLDNQLCFALYAANRAITARYRPLLAELNLTYPQYLVMLVLWEAGENGQTVRVSDLGKRLRLDSGTLTPLLKRLAERGLVTRLRDTIDERVVTVAPTEKGSAMRQEARDIPGRLLCGTGIDQERIVELREELRSVLSLLEAEEGPSGR